MYKFTHFLNDMHAWHNYMKPCWFFGGLNTEERSLLPGTYNLYDYYTEGSYIRLTL